MACLTFAFTACNAFDSSGDNPSADSEHTDGIVSVPDATTPDETPYDKPGDDTAQLPEDKPNDDPSAGEDKNDPKDDPSENEKPGTEPPEDDIPDKP